MLTPDERAALEVLRQTHRRQQAACRALQALVQTVDAESAAALAAIAAILGDEEDRAPRRGGR